jgi:S1-C subfamily serine protease
MAQNNDKNTIARNPNSFRFLKYWLLILCAWMLLPTTAYTTSCNKPFSDVFRDISPSVVRIFMVAIDPYSALQRVQLGVGTGVVIDNDGHIVTNAHLVYETNEIIVSFGDEDMQSAEIIGIDPITDLAVIKLIAPMAQLKKAKLGRSAKLVVGEEVLAVGYPLGIGKTATRGIVSAIERVVPLSTFSWMTPFIQTDAAINPGNSGGPLINRCGEVIGINTLYGERVQNINFAIPIDLVHELVPQLIKDGRIIRPWHGINGRIIPPQLMYFMGGAPGFMVETIEPGSPADKIDLRGGSLPIKIGLEEYLLGGDIITKVNDEPLTDMGTVARIAQSLKVGDKVKLEYWREGQTHTAEVILPERPILPGDVRHFRDERRPR